MPRSRRPPGFTSNGLSIIVSSEDPALVESTTATVVEALEGNPDLANLQSDLVKATAEIQVTVDPTKAFSVGLTAAQVANEVRTALVSQTVTQVTFEDGQPIDLVIQVDPEATTSVEELRGAARRDRDQGAARAGRDRRAGRRPGQHHPHRPVAGRRRSPPRSPPRTPAPCRPSVQATLDGLVADGSIPAGVTVELAGVSQQQTEAFSGLFASMGVAVLLVYVMMVLTFNSLITPFIILFSLPLALIGAFPALYLTDRPIGVSALIGFLMLIGIVVTNAIVLLDLVERLRHEGMGTRDALIHGGRTRVRPILMTAIATILALIPLAAGFNEGSIIAAELGTVVIGGLFSSTFLTLIVVPAVYLLVDGVKRRLSRGWGTSVTRSHLAPRRPDHGQGGSAPSWRTAVPSGQRGTRSRVPVS